MENYPNPAYDGLRNTAGDIFRIITDRVAQERAEDLRRFGGGDDYGLLDIIYYFLNNVQGFLNPSYWTQYLWFNVFWPGIEAAGAWIAGPIKGAIGDVWGFFNTWATEAFQSWTYMISSPIESIWRWLLNLPQFLWNAFAGALGTGVVPFLDALWQTFGRISGYLFLHLPSISQLVNFIPSLPGLFVAGLSGLFNSVVSAIISAPFDLGSIISGALTGVGGGLISGLMGLPAQFGLYMIQNAALIWAWIQLKAGELWNSWGPRVVNAYNTILPIGRQLIGQLFDGVATLPSTFFQFVSSLCGSDLALNPSRAFTTLIAAYGLAIAAGSTAHVISAALDLVPTLNWVGAAQLAGLVSEVAAFGPLTNAAYGSLIQDAIAQPLKAYWNSQLRPNLPNEMSLAEMRTHRIISYREYASGMAYKGYPNYWIEKIHNIIWTNPNPNFLQRMSTYSLPNADWIRSKLEDLGFNDTDIPIMLDGMKARTLAPTVAILKTAARGMMREAYWTESTARALLAAYGVGAEEVHALALAEGITFQNTYLDSQVAYYSAAFQKSQISEQDLALALATIYVRPERAAQILARERIKKIPKPKVKAAPEENPLIKSLRTQAVNSWIARYRKWEISAEDLRLGLTIVVQDSALAGQLVDAELTRYRPAPEVPALPAEDPILAASRRQAIASYVTAFRDGKIDAGELELYLSQLIPDPATRTQLVELEKLRYQPAPDLIPTPAEDPALAKLRAEYVRGHISMFQNRSIGLDELYSFLQQDGLAETLARAVVITEANKRIKVPPSSSAYYQPESLATLANAGLDSEEQRFINGVISFDEFIAWITALVPDPPLALYLADQADLKRFSESL